MPSKKIRCFLFFVIAFLQVHAQQKTDRFLQEFLQKDTSAIMQQVLQDPNTYRYQVIYTQISRDSKNNPAFNNFYLHVDSLQYFNPASTVKLPLALLALEKLHELNIPGVDKNTVVQYDSSYSGQSVAYTDSTALHGFPSIAQYIKKVFLISDNDAYNRLYEFVGQQTINRKLHDKGYADVRITRRFEPNTADENRHTNRIRFLSEEDSLLFVQPPAYNTDSFDFSHTIKMGNAYYNRDDSLIHEPMDFTTHNNISLEDLQQILQSVLFPASVPQKQRFDLAKDDYDFLYQYMSQYPSETNFPKYDTASYFDSYVKFYFRNSTHKIPDYIRVFNKVGWSYGFLTDVSYVVDFKNKIEFMLAATIYVNSDGVLNDDKYDYDSIGYPFMYQLGQDIYNYELKRQRENIPNLNRFKVHYEKRDERDTRPTIKSADN